MAFPSDLVRTKNWGTEILTDADLEGQFDLTNAWVMASLNSTSGHKHTGSSNDAPKLSDTSLNQITTAAKVSVTAITGTLPVGNGGTGSTAAANSASGVVVLNASSQLPAVDGSLLTNMVSTTKTKSGIFTITGTGNLAITGVGFTPKAVILYSVTLGTSSDAITYTTHGFATTGVNISYVAQANRDGAGVTESQTTILNNNGSGPSATFTVTTYGADGFTVNVSAYASASSNWHYLAIG